MENHILGYGYFPRKRLKEMPAWYLLNLYEHDKCDAITECYIKENWEELISQSREQKTFEEIKGETK